ncbi:MAG: methyltransferase domain-containing protein [Thermodesulfobacteriota bacterium]
MIRTVLLGATPRSLDERRRLATPARRAAQTTDHQAFGYDYFDNPAAMGYGGYRYDGRFADEAARVARFFELVPSARILEIGCAKGYLLVEFAKLGFAVTGIDLSPYAVTQAHPLLAGCLRQGGAVDFDFPAGYFDLAIAKEVLPHMERDEVKATVQRLATWARHTLLVIQCVSAPAMAEAFLNWDSTHRLALTAGQWEELLEEVGYSGYVHFKDIV